MLKTHRNRLPLLLPALACALLLAACGSSKSETTSSGEAVLSTAQTKAAIEQSILSQRHIHATVVCPSEVVKEKGVTFECVATTTNGGKTTFHVVEVNKFGRVEYSSPPGTSTTNTSTSTTKKK